MTEKLYKKFVQSVYPIFTKSQLLVKISNMTFQDEITVYIMSIYGVNIFTNVFKNK